MPSQPAIRVEDLTRRFGSFTALSEVSFTVDTGEVVALLGHNGAGKTTLLRLVNGLLRPTTGAVTTLGLDPIFDGQRVRGRTGVLTEYPALDDFLTTGENLRTYGRMYGIPEEQLRPRIHYWLERLGLGDKESTPCRDLSAGLRQRVALARAILHAPELLLLDEPTSNLDPLAARAVREIVIEQSREFGRTLLVSTHNLAEAAAIADKVVILRDGRVLATGPVSSLTDGDSAAITITMASPADQPRAMLVLQRLAGTVHAHGQPGTVTVPTTNSNASRLIGALVHEGIDVAAAVPQAPSLEDVYVGLHENGNRGSGDGPVKDETSGTDSRLARS